MKKKINSALKKARLNADLTQVEVANKVGISERAYQNYESGIRVPNAYIAQRIAKVVNSSVEALFTEIKSSE